MKKFLIKFGKTAKKLMPLFWCWLFGYGIVIFILYTSTSTECPDTTSNTYLTWTMLWWLIYWWILWMYSKIDAAVQEWSKTFLKEEMNYKKGYHTMRAHYMGASKTAQILAHKCKIRALQIRDYSNFIHKLLAEGRVTQEEISAGVIKSFKEYSRIVRENESRNSPKKNSDAVN